MLLLHLKRFHVTSSGSLQKVTYAVRLPDILDLSAYCSDTVALPPPMDLTPRATAEAEKLAKQAKEVYKGLNDSQSPVVAAAAAVKVAARDGTPDRPGSSTKRRILKSPTKNPRYTLDDDSPGSSDDFESKVRGQLACGH